MRDTASIDNEIQKEIDIFESKIAQLLIERCKLQPTITEKHFMDAWYVGNNAIVSVKSWELLLDFFNQVTEESTPYTNFQTGKKYKGKKLSKKVNNIWEDLCKLNSK